MHRRWAISGEGQVLIKTMRFDSQIMVVRTLKLLELCFIPELNETVFTAIKCFINLAFCHLSGALNLNISRLALVSKIMSAEYSF